MVHASTKGNSDTREAAGAIGLLCFGIFSVIGLMLVTIADVDVNDYFRTHQCRLIAFMLIWATGFVVQSRVYPVVWIAALPFIVLLVWYKQVVQMQDGYPFFTQLFEEAIGLFRG